jgi:DNA-directed RNA polymerase sigma subunit (sigma70/sigma32)
MLMKIRRAKHQMQQEIGREPSTPELAHYLELPVAKLQQYTDICRNVVSLENPLRTSSSKGDLDRRTIGDTIASDAPTPLEDAQHEWLLQDLQQVLHDVLLPNERSVLMARYGLDDGHAKSLEETSRILNLSRERVRLVEAKALNKLRHPQKNYRLKTYLQTTTHEDEEHHHQDKSMTVGLNMETPSSGIHNSNRVVDTTNPFANPMDYMERRSQESGEAPAPDRMWFF